MIGCRRVATLCTFALLVAASAAAAQEFPTRIAIDGSPPLAEIRFGPLTPRDARGQSFVGAASLVFDNGTRLALAAAVKWNAKRGEATCTLRPEMKGPVTVGIKFTLAGEAFTKFSLKFQARVKDPALAGLSEAGRVTFTGVDPFQDLSFAGAAGQLATGSDFALLLTTKEKGERSSHALAAATRSPAIKAKLTLENGELARFAFSFRLQKRDVAGLSVLDEPPPPLIGSLLVDRPAQDVSGSRGSVIEIHYLDDVAGETAQTTLFADRDGDIMTGEDQFVIAAGRPEADGAPQTVRWSTAGLPPGAYHVLARTLSPNGSPLLAEAPGQVTVTDASWAVSYGSTATDTLESLTAWSDGSVALSGTGNREYPEGEGFVARFAAGGVFNWRVGAQAPEDLAYRELHAMPDGALVTIGSAWEDVTLDLGGDHQTPLSEGPFWGKYDSDGALSYAVAAPGPAAVDWALVRVLADGSFLAAGVFEGTTVFDPGGPNQTTLVSRGGLDVCLARYGSDRSLVWAGFFGSGDDDEPPSAIVAFPDGSMIVVQRSDGAVTYDPGGPNETVVPAGESVLARYSSSGTLEDVNPFPVPATARVLGASPMPGGGFFLMGSFTGNAAFGPGAGTLKSAGAADQFFVRYGSDEALMWARKIGSIRDDFFDTRAAVFADGSVVLVGACFEVEMLGATGLPPVDLSGRGGWRARIDLDGTVLWLKPMESVGDSGLRVAPFPDGSFVIGGQFMDAVDFGAGTEKHVRLGPALGPREDRDLFLVRLNADGDM